MHEESRIVHIFRHVWVQMDFKSHHNTFVPIGISGTRHSDTSLQKFWIKTVKTKFSPVIQLILNFPRVKNIFYRIKWPKMDIEFKQSAVIVLSHTRELILTVPPIN